MLQKASVPAGSHTAVSEFVPGETHEAYRSRNVSNGEAVRAARALYKSLVLKTRDVPANLEPDPWLAYTFVGRLASMDDDPTGAALRAWLDSGIPVDHMERYLLARSTLAEAIAQESNGTYDPDALDLLAALLKREPYGP